MAGKTREKAVTQTDIAKELNISVVSVSNALSGRKGVSSELRQLILDTAEEMGYQGEIRGSIAQERGLRIGVVISSRYLYDTPSFYMKIYQEIVVAAAEKKCVTFLEVLDTDREESGKLPDLMTGGQADGILVIGELNMRYTQIVKENSRVPVIFVDYYEDLPETDFIISDGYTGTYRLTRRLLEAGYREIAFMGNIRATSSIMDRYLGYRKALMERQIPLVPEWIIPDREDESRSVFVKLPEKMPEAFVCNCDKTAGMLIRKLLEAGYRVPEDVGVVGFDHFLQEEVAGITLTTYDVDIRKIAGVSVRTLIRKVDHTCFTPRLQVINGKVIEGNSYRMRST